jgi:Uma2 family endonuclease
MSAITAPLPAISQVCPPANAPPPLATPSPDLIARLYRLTVGQYDQIIASGIIAENERVELIEGLLVAKMGRNRPHVQAGSKGLRVIDRVLPATWHARKEDPIIVSDGSKPEPDLAVVRGEIEDYDHRDVMATDVGLVVEIAESSLSADRIEMKRIYSASGIPAYWIVNLIDRQLEVYTDPTQDGYRTTRILDANQTVELILDGVEVATIAVASLLP